MKWVCILVSLISLSLVTGCSKVKPAATQSYTQNSTLAPLAHYSNANSIRAYLRHGKTVKLQVWSGFLKVHFNWVQT